MEAETSPLTAERHTDKAPKIEAPATLHKVVIMSEQYENANGNVTRTEQNR